jgi:hypothetical protein
LPYAALDRIRELEQSGCLGVDGDIEHLRVEDVADPVADDFVDRLRVQLTGDRLLHAVDQSELGVPLPRLADEPRVVERGAKAPRQRRQQLLVGFGEGMLAIEVVERDHAPRFAARDEWHVERGLRHLAGPEHRVAEPLRRLGNVLVDQQWLARLHHVPPEAELAQRHRLVGIPDPALDRVREVDEPRGLVVNGDVDDLCVENRLEFVSDDVVDRLQLELARKRLLDAVDERELGVALTLGRRLAAGRHPDVDPALSHDRKYGARRERRLGVVPSHVVQFGESSSGRRAAEAAAWS